MKTLVKKLFVLFMSVALNLVVLSNSLADDGKFAYVLHPLNNTNLLYFGFNVNPKNLDVEIKIRDERGVILHKESFKSKEKAAKLFDFQNLGKGKFVVEVIAGDFSEKRNIVIGEKMKADEPIQVQVTPQIKGVEVIYINNESQVAISIVDEKGNVLHNEVSSIRDYRRTFNTKKLPKGTYIVRVAQGTHTYEQNYIVK